jgi:protein CpxP
MRIAKCLLPFFALMIALAATPQQAPRSQVQRMVDQLNVTAEQKAKLDPILEEDSKQVRLLRGDTSTGAVEKKAAIRKDTDAKIKPILTDEQWKKLVQLREDRSKQDKKKK